MHVFKAISTTSSSNGSKFPETSMALKLLYPLIAIKYPWKSEIAFCSWMKIAIELSKCVRSALCECFMSCKVIAQIVEERKKAYSNKC